MARAFPRPSASACSTASTATAQGSKKSRARGWGSRWCGRLRGGTGARRAARRRAGGAVASSWSCLSTVRAPLYITLRPQIRSICMPTPTLTHLERRKIEGGVLIPMVQAFQRAIGKERANEIAREVIIELARRDGERWARQFGEDLAAMEQVSKVWAG